MTGISRVVRASFIFVAALIAAAGCTAVTLKDGVVGCDKKNNNACPDGFTCHAADLKCYRNNYNFDGGAGSGGNGGSTTSTGGSGGSNPDGSPDSMSDGGTGCPTLQDPAGGTVSTTSLEVGGTATYTCNLGADLNGEATRTCRADGTWSGTAPTCGVKDCGPLTSPTNGTVATPMGTAVDAVATYSCKTGYGASPSATRMCQIDGTWSGVQPTCVVANCPQLAAPMNGNVSAMLTFGAQAQYTCNSGYTLTGKATSTCNNDGTWSDPAPTCVIKDCGAVTKPTNGSVTSTTTTYGSTATFACGMGYTVSGAASIKCQADGTWSASSPTCTVADCGAPTAPTNGTVSAPTTTYGATATFACKLGYLQAGSPTQTCGADGHWAGAAPTCAIADCGALTAPTNGMVAATATTYGSVATYTCTTGYGPSGSPTRTCGADGKWDGVAPTCVLATCPNLTSPAGGSVTATPTYNGTATYSCNTGYTISGAATRTCLANGTWSGAAPTCTIKNCGALTAPTNGTVTDPTTTYGASATYACNTGYSASGALTSTCQADGTWSGTAPTCTIKNCGTLTGPTNGSIAVTTTTYGSTATYSCNDSSGYALAGAATRTCGADGNWSGTAPTCVIRDCGALTNPTNGSVSDPTTTVGATATYSCTTGYGPSGSATRTCQTNGAWSGTAPTCVIAQCPALNSPTGGSVSAPNLTYGSTAMYTCNTGYSLVGIASRTCQASGTWSGSPPTCAPVDCGVPSKPGNGTVTYTTTTYGSSATYGCNTGYTLSGATTTTCQANQAWSGTLPTCVPHDCGALSISNGNATYSSTTLGATATVNCNTNYVLSGGTSPTTCTASGWSPKLTCVDVCTTGGNGTASHCCTNAACPGTAPDCNTTTHTCAAKTVGETCTANGQCGTGACVSNGAGSSVCCSTSCTGACDSHVCAGGSCGFAPLKTRCGQITGPSGPGWHDDVQLYCNGAGSCIAPTITCAGFSNVSCNLATNACCVTGSASSYVCGPPSACVTPDNGDFFSGRTCYSASDCPTSYDCCDMDTGNGGYWNVCVPSGTCTGTVL
ncbi:MAG TPA: hypothetical protein VHJ20_15240 [Polyangia bacterium]|nr:hypothetical protein [Polyangia bacterium]